MNVSFKQSIGAVKAVRIKYYLSMDLNGMYEERGQAGRLVRGPRRQGKGGPIVRNDAFMESRGTSEATKTAVQPTAVGRPSVAPLMGA